MTGFPIFVSEKESGIWIYMIDAGERELPAERV
jgi:hypothetical protein